MPFYTKIISHAYKFKINKNTFCREVLKNIYEFRLDDIISMFTQIECNNHYYIKGEVGKLKFYFRKIPLHQQKILVISVLSNSP